jgi:hypothetical protein
MAQKARRGLPGHGIMGMEDRGSLTKTAAWGRWACRAILGGSVLNIDRRGRVRRQAYPVHGMLYRITPGDNSGQHHVDMCGA